MPILPTRKPPTPETGEPDSTHRLSQAETNSAPTKQAKAPEPEAVGVLPLKPLCPNCKGWGLWYAQLCSECRGTGRLQPDESTVGPPDPEIVR